MDSLIDIAMFTSLTMQNKEALERLLKNMMLRQNEIGSKYLIKFAGIANKERSKGVVNGPYSQFITTLMGNRNR